MILSDFPFIYSSVKAGSVKAGIDKLAFTVCPVLKADWYDCFDGTLAFHCLKDQTLQSN